MEVPLCATQWQKTESDLDSPLKDFAAKWPRQQKQVIMAKQSKHCNNGTNNRAWEWRVAVLFWLKDFRNGTLQQADQGAEGQRFGPRREG